MKAAHLRTALFGFVSLSCSTQGFKGVDDAEPDADAPPTPTVDRPDAEADAATEADAAATDASDETLSSLIEAGPSAEASIERTDASSGETESAGASGDDVNDAGPSVDAQLPSDAELTNESETPPDSGLTSSANAPDAMTSPSEACTDAGADAAAMCGSSECEGDEACTDNDAAPPSTECLRGPSPCSSSEVARLTSEHVLDGYGDEFCNVPAFELNFANAAHGVSNLPQTALIRVAWSTAALHVFAEVSDPEIATNSNLDWLWDGDTIELYLATSEASQLTGFFTGRVDGVQMVFAPPSAEHPARAARLFWLPDNNDSWRQVREEVTRDFSARVTDEGYAIEAKIQWSKFGPRTPDIEAGMTIAFNLGLSTASAQSLQDGGREGAALLYVGDAASGVETCEGEQMPWCNSTTWCSPVLQ